MDSADPYTLHEMQAAGRVISLEREVAGLHGDVETRTPRREQVLAFNPSSPNPKHSPRNLNFNPEARNLKPRLGERV